MSGVIEPGPNAQRTQTYFKQDGEYQEKIFREIEERVPSIEHLEIGTRITSMGCAT